MILRCFHWRKAFQSSGACQFSCLGFLHVMEAFTYKSIKSMMLSKSVNLFNHNHAKLVKCQRSNQAFPKLWITMKFWSLFPSGYALDDNINFLQFCDSAPEGLAECKVGSRKRPAYSSYQYYDKATSEKAFLKDEMHCLCPEGFNYLDTRYKFYSEGKFDVVATLYYCEPVSWYILLNWAAAEI